MEVEIVKKK